MLLVVVQNTTTKLGWQAVHLHHTKNYPIAGSGDGDVSGADSSTMTQLLFGLSWPNIEGSS
jgi:hypothetical protein